MAEDWKAHADEISREFREIGILLTGTRFHPGSYDPLLGAYVGDVELPFSVFGVFEDVTSQKDFAQVVTEFSILEGDLLIQFVTDGTIIFSEEDIQIYVPAVGDYIEWQGATWTIQGVSAVQPGGIALLYSIFIRRA